MVCDPDGVTDFHLVRPYQHFEPGERGVRRSPAGGARLSFRDSDENASARADGLMTVFRVDAPRGLYKPTEIFSRPEHETERGCCANIRIPVRPIERLSDGRTRADHEFERGRDAKGLFEQQIAGPLRAPGR